MLFIFCNTSMLRVGPFKLLFHTAGFDIRARMHHVPVVFWLDLELVSNWLVVTAIVIVSSCVFYCHVGWP